MCGQCVPLFCRLGMRLRFVYQFSMVQFVNLLGIFGTRLQAYLHQFWLVFEIHTHIWQEALEKVWSVKTANYMLNWNPYFIHRPTYIYTMQFMCVKPHLFLSSPFKLYMYWGVSGGFWGTKVGFSYYGVSKQDWYFISNNPPGIFSHKLANWKLYSTIRRSKLNAAVEWINLARQYSFQQKCWHSNFAQLALRTCQSRIIIATYNFFAV